MYQSKRYICTSEKKRPAYIIMISAALCLSPTPSFSLPCFFILVNRGGGVGSAPTSGAAFPYSLPPSVGFAVAFLHDQAGGSPLMPTTHFHHRCWTFIKCFSRVYLSMTLCFYTCHVISDIIGFQTWSQHHIPSIYSNLFWCAIIFIQPCILFAANLVRILCLCRDRNSLLLSLLMMSSFSSNIRVMLPSFKKLENVLSLFYSICVKLVLFNVWKNSAVKPSGLKIFLWEDF